MGIVTQTIGTAGRNFSTLQLWEDALPANLVTDGNSYVGECYNDTEFANSAAPLLTISGETTDSTHTITLQCATGQSFKDNGSRQTNALRYNQANGVGCSVTGYNAGIGSAVGNVTIDGLQIKLAAASEKAVDFPLSTVPAIIQNCLVSSPGTSGRIGTVFSGVGGVFRNNLIIYGGSSAAVDITVNQGAAAYANNTIVQPSDSVNFGTGIAIRGGGGHYTGVNVAINNAVFGFATFCNTLAAFGGTSGNNCTDLISATVPGSANQVSKTYASQFQDTATATADFRAKTGADLVNNGATDTTDIPAAIDIVGTARPQGAAWDIGVWELVATAAAVYALINVM